MLDRAIDGLKSDEAKALREFSDPTSLTQTTYPSWRSRRSPPAQPSSETVKPTPELVSRLNH